MNKVVAHPRIPLLPTILVIAAIGTMIALGFWQLQRLAWKEALIARYAHAQDLPAVAWPRDPADRADALYRRSSVSCERVITSGAVAGRNAKGDSGWAQTARCAIGGGGNADIVLGWSSDPALHAFTAGEIVGRIGPAARDGVRLIADPPLAGLAANALPDPRDLPNNHLAYAVQWFLFAATAAVIYILALRKRLRAGAGR